MRLSIANVWYVYLYRQHTSLPIHASAQRYIESKNTHRSHTHAAHIYTAQEEPDVLTTILHADIHSRSHYNCITLCTFIHIHYRTHPLPHTKGLNGTDTYHQKALPYRSISLNPHLPALCTGPSTVQRIMDPTHPRTCSDRHNYYIV